MSKNGSEAKSQLPTGQRVTSGFPVFTCGPTPMVKEQEWSFTLFGIVEREMRWTLCQFWDLPATKICADFHCVTKWSRLNNEWEGVSAFEILRHIRPTQPIGCVMIHCYGGYSTNVRFQDFCKPDVLFAYKHNGYELVREHGWPLRLVVPSLYGWKSAKWVTGAELLSEEKAGYWEQRGYHMHGDPWKEERFSTKSRLSSSEKKA